MDCTRVVGGLCGVDVEARPLAEVVAIHVGDAEVFLSWETPDRATLFAFLRLRLPGPGCRTPFAELAGAAYVREVHVYGQLVHLHLHPHARAGPLSGRGSGRCT